jgi:hypothetical protein
MKRLRAAQLKTGHHSLDIDILSRLWFSGDVGENIVNVKASSKQHETAGVGAAAAFNGELRQSKKLIREKKKLALAHSGDTSSISYCDTFAAFGWRKKQAKTTKKTKKRKKTKKKKKKKKKKKATKQKKKIKSLDISLDYLAAGISVNSIFASVILFVIYT